MKKSNQKIKKTPLVAMVMGSDSDFPYLKEARTLLKKLKIPFSCEVVSAHRSPDKIKIFVQQVEKNKTQVIIAAAGGAAHLPGMIAAYSKLPVIGIPIQTKSLKGLDSLFSIVQMPKGVCVATVAINNSYNAALLAAQILALKQSNLKNYLNKLKQEQKNYVKKQNKKVQKK